MDKEIATLLADFVEKVGWLRRDMQQKKELEKYEARFLRIEQKFSALAQRIARDDEALAKEIRTAWQMPARRSAFRNAEHQKALKGPGPSGDD
jgi:exonuclease V gamma subunit